MHDADRSRSSILMPSQQLPIACADDISTVPTKHRSHGTSAGLDITNAVQPPFCSNDLTIIFLSPALGQQRRLGAAVTFVGFSGEEVHIQSDELADSGSALSVTLLRRSHSRLTF